MKAIITKYHGPTDTKGSRISAQAEGGARPHRVTIPYPSELNSQEAHERAARALCERLGWYGLLIGGGLPDQTGYAFVFGPNFRALSASGNTAIDAPLAGLRSSKRNTSKR